MSSASLIQAAQIDTASGAVIIDCRFSLPDPGAGQEQYRLGHIPGAHYLDLARDLSGPPGLHGGRHPLPEAGQFVARLASIGVGPETQVVAYDDSRLAFSARLWWMMRSLGFRPPALLDGGYQAWLAGGGRPELHSPPREESTTADLTIDAYRGVCDIEGLRMAQARGAVVIDSRESGRYRGLEEPIDPVAGHIPGALNRPWQGVTNESGRVGPIEAQRQHLGDVLDAQEVVVYCGSGVTACVNLFSLAMVGRDDAVLYAGSWSDWCSYLPVD
jgi:thiosulfate/3-mercaptopyruvate sulfurtransferase